MSSIPDPTCGVNTPPTSKHSAESDYDLVSLDHMATGWIGAQKPGPHVLVVHPARMCAGETCCIHNPSDHHMRTWPMNWRDDTKVMERLCPHGVGHPDPDALAFNVRGGRDYYGVHGCDGCCHPRSGNPTPPGQRGDA